MKIFIDIGHPAHVHYFRNFIQLMQNKGHEFFISARNRSIIFYLLQHYGIKYYNRGKGRNGIIGKLLYMLIADLKLFRKAIKFKPDIFLSFASPYAAQVSWMLGKPHIALDDTEHAKFSQAFYKPFSDVLLNPYCFLSDFGKKQIHFNSLVELFYLHPNYYSPPDDVSGLLGIQANEKFILLRFVSWQANHDIGHSGLDIETKKKLVESLSKDFKIFISIEGENKDSFFDPYLLKIPPENIHDVLFHADLFIAESGTMASEAVILGTPVIYVNSLPLMGYLRDEADAGILFHHKNSQNVIEKVDELLAIKDLKKEMKPKLDNLLADKIDLTSFLLWFIETYPDSYQIMKENPDYQNTFK